MDDFTAEEIPYRRCDLVYIAFLAVGFLVGFYALGFFSLALDFDGWIFMGYKLYEIL